jgi:hypothetical protein
MLCSHDNSALGGGFSHRPSNKRNEALWPNTRLLPSRKVEGSTLSKVPMMTCRYHATALLGIALRNERPDVSCSGAGAPNRAWANIFASDERIAVAIGDDRVQGVAQTVSEKAGRLVAARVDIVVKAGATTHSNSGPGDSNLIAVTQALTHRPQCHIS